MEKRHAEGGGEGGRLFVRSRCAHGGQRRGERQHAEAGVEDAGDPPRRSGFGKMQRLECCGRCREICAGERQAADDDGQRSHERGDKPDDGSQTPETEPYGQNRCGGHDRGTGDDRDAEILVQCRARSGNHDEIAAADKNGAEPVENRTDRFAEIVREEGSTLLRRKLLPFVEQLPREEKVDDKGDQQCADRALDTVGNKKRQTFGSGRKAGTDTSTDKSSAEFDCCGKLKFFALVSHRCTLTFSFSFTNYELLSLSNRARQHRLRSVRLVT